jgi:hypothetical protein
MNPAAFPLSFKERLQVPLPVGDRFAKLPSGHAWLAGSALALALAFYLLTPAWARLLIPLAIVGSLVYRHPPSTAAIDGRLSERARLPEVRFIACQYRRITVG